LHDPFFLWSKTGNVILPVSGNKFAIHFFPVRGRIVKIAVQTHILTPCPLSKLERGWLEEPGLPAGRQADSVDSESAFHTACNNYNTAVSFIR